MEGPGALKEDEIETEMADETSERLCWGLIEEA